MNFERHQYPPMLGPLEAVPAGTPEWAERLGLRILNAVETTEQHGVNHLIPLIEAALQAKPPKPWNTPFGPGDRPCRTPDNYLRYAAGVDCTSIAKLIAAYKGEDHPLVLQLRRHTAEAEAAIAEENEKRGKADPHDDIMRVKQGTSSAYLLRRLARDHPDVLDAYERGEFPSARAAAKAAGIVKDVTPLELLQKAWAKASAAEREAFLQAVHQ